MTLGTKLGPYEIISHLGEGGMGDVYKAKDTRLGRTVAIKILKDQFTERFEKEARAVATLNHPNICAIYDVGPNYLVLEYLEGKPLSTPQPLRDVLKIGAQVAGALEAAHRKGIVHCDLKPANILITANGAKVLDFGLARQARIERASTETTVTAGSIVESTIEGTLPYMAPEQLEARDVDRRTDIFALGAVLYEMATGARAFPGESQASIIASVLHTEPEQPSKRKSGLPQHLDRIIARCLAKDPEDRWQSARDIALELKTVTEDKPVRTRIPWLPIAAALVLTAAAAYFLRPKEPKPLAQVAIPIPDDVFLSNFGAVISPDGKRIAFSAKRNGRLLLMIRDVESPVLRAVDGSEGTQMAFWAPDGRSIGFFAQGWLKRYDTATSTVQTITRVAAGRGGTWAPNGSILFNANMSTPLYLVPAAGGPTQPFTLLDAARGDMRHVLPQALPDGKHILFFISSTDPRRTGVYWTTFENPRKIEPIPELLGLQSQAIYTVAPGTSEGYLIFHRDKSLVAQTFDLAAMKLTGAPRSILPREFATSSTHTPGFLSLSISNTGAMLSGGAVEASSTIQWRSLAGSLLEPPWKADDYLTPSLSPKSDRLAVSRVDPGNGNYDIWIYAPKDPRPSRLTFQPGTDYYPIWSPDEKFVYFTGDQEGRMGIFRRSADGSREVDKVYVHATDAFFAYDISADGKLLLVGSVPPSNRGDIWLVPLDDPNAAAPLLNTTAAELLPQFSPAPQAGKWIVYISDEMGQDQVFVRRFDGKSLSSEKWQISTNGGRWPRWRGDGSTIVYMNNEDRFMSVDIRFNGNTVQVGAPRELFFAAIPAMPWTRFPYDLSADGKRIAIAEAAPSRSSGFLELIFNWPELLNR